MDLNLLTRDADNLIRKVVSRYNQLYVPAGHISQVELDLMLDDLRKLYDTFKTIGQVNLTQQQDENKPEVTVGTPMQTKAADVTENVIPAPKQEVTPATQQEFKPEKVAEAVAETFPETNPEPAAEPEAEPEIIPETEPEILADTKTDDSPAVEKYPSAEEEIHETQKPVEAESTDTQSPDKQESAMLADKFNIANKSLSETMAKSPANSFVGGRMQFQPISDLATGIGLNDKFTFINELFGNNPARYEEAITRINKAVNADEAGWILQKYHSAEWQNKAETLQRLKDFVKRRFI
jgi:hypothetical protein